MGYELPDTPGLNVVQFREKTLVTTLPFAREEGTFYGMLTFEANRFEARVLDSQGDCRAYAQVTYDPATGTAAEAHLMDEGLLANVLQYSWTDIQDVKDLRVLGSLPALELLLFHDERLPVRAFPEDIN